MTLEEKLKQCEAIYLLAQKQIFSLKTDKEKAEWVKQNTCIPKK